jgi:N-acetylglucosamine-6-phosphate deacetylase
MAAIADARDADPDVAHAIAAVHVEGPHISGEDGPRGAHPREHVRPPDAAEYRRWQDAARGIVGIVTMAPEWPDAVAYISALTDDGVLVAIGHTAATEAEIRAAVEAGASLSTHLGNGAHAVIRRHPNYIWDQLAEDRLWASMVLDGRHLPRSVIRTFLRAKGTERIIAVSDAVTFAGMPPGRYEGFGTALELREDGSLHVAGTQYLAGSTTSLDVAIGVAMRDGGLAIDEAVRLVTSNPASLLGSRLEGDRGQVRIGASADLVVFRLDPQDMDVTVERTVVAGREVFNGGQAQGRGVP